ncbi:MAG: 3-hydroxyacyl-CoA dehydrogenase [Candidatus Hydrogenedentota bacterium]|nr:MAG: 3-hydroxyacyl-CoA dehydrogenase [Candidatus Hydrogenedentota bacterium]
MLLSKKTFIVTGGASGLGAACVRKLRDSEANVVIADLNEEGAKVAENLGSNVMFVKTDVASEDDVKKMLDKVEETFGDIHGVVQCAGIATAARILTPKGPHSLELFEKTIRVNLIGTFNVMRLAAERIAKHDPAKDEEECGVIINTASVAAFDGQIGQVAYSASKGGVAAMTLPAARDLARYKIRVMTIAPGTFYTPMLAKLPEKVRIALEKLTPFPPRLGRPDEFANLVLSIIQNPMLNGEVIRIDGALRMPP